MEVFFTETTSTGTAASFSPDSLEQPASRSARVPATAAADRHRRPTADGRVGGRPAEQPRTMVEGCMRLEIPRQGLKISHRHPKPHLAVIVGVARPSQRVLGVHHFEHRGFPPLIAQSSQTQTLRRQFRRLVSAIPVRGARFGLRCRTSAGLRATSAARNSIPLSPDPAASPLASGDCDWPPSPRWATAGWRWLHNRDCAHPAPRPGSNSRVANRLASMP